jgi:phospholipid transport system substrate-binding protein
MIMRLLSRAAFAMFVLCGVVAGSARAATDPTATINNFYGALLQTMKQGPQLGDAGRFNALAPAVRQSFDLNAMTQMAVGPSWARLTPVERQQVTDAFARYITATYADHFDRFNGEKLNVGGARPAPYGTIVETHIVDAKGNDTIVNYLMRQNGNEWQVADIYLQGTISQIANLRSQFSSVVLRGGAQALVETLNRKTASLVPNSTAS